MLASTMQFTTNPPTPPTQFLEEGVFGPGRTAPEPDSVPRPAPTETQSKETP